MASKRKQGTLADVGHAVADAAKTAMGVAEDYGVKPVSNALGLTSKTRKSPKRSKKKAVSKRSRAPAVRATNSRTTAKRPAAAKRGAKRKGK